MNKKEKQKIINDLYNTGFYNFNYKEYFKIKRKLGKKIDKDIREVIKRIESHPTWLKSKKEHEKYCRDIEHNEMERYEKKMVHDAIHGDHYKYVNVLYGELRIDQDYKRICDKLNIKIDITEMSK